MYEYNIFPFEEDKALDVSNFDHINGADGHCDLEDSENWEKNWEDPDSPVENFGFYFPPGETADADYFEQFPACREYLEEEEEAQNQVSTAVSNPQTQSDDWFDLLNIDYRSSSASGLDPEEETNAIGFELFSLLILNPEETELHRAFADLLELSVCITLFMNSSYEYQRCLSPSTPCRSEEDVLRNSRLFNWLFRTQCIFAGRIVELISANPDYIENLITTYVTKTGAHLIFVENALEGFNKNKLSIEKSDLYPGPNVNVLYKEPTESAQEQFTNFTIVFKGMYDKYDRLRHLADILYSHSFKDDVKSIKRIKDCLKPLPGTPEGLELWTDCFLKDSEIRAVDLMDIARSLE